MHAFKFAAVLGGLVALVAAAPRALPDCWSSESAPNPLSALYPQSLTGTLNGTIFVIPVQQSIVDDVIRGRWPVLRNAIDELFHGYFPVDRYPLIIQAGIEHDLEGGGQVAASDSQSIRILFPFIDYFGDGHTSLTYTHNMIVDPAIATVEYSKYGIVPVRANFSPKCEAAAAYAYGPHPSTYGGGAPKKFHTFLDAKDVDGAWTAHTETSWWTGRGLVPFPFIVNVTNQFIFGDVGLCFHQRPYFNYTITEGNYAPMAITGNVVLPAPSFLNKTFSEQNVMGYKMDYPFVKDLAVDCHTAQGFPTPS